MKVIVGGTYQRFREWCRDNDLPPSKAIFADGWEKLLGLELAAEDIVRLGPISDQTESVLRSRIRLPSPSDTSGEGSPDTR